MEKEFTEAIINGAKNAIQSLSENKDVTVTCFLPLQKSKDVTWYLVLAWQDGFDTNETDAFAYKEYRICGKVAYCTNNSVMHDYDMDFIMPYNERTGDVFNTETSISEHDDINALMEFWSDSWKTIKEQYIKNE